jgi:hypothetical protein
LYILFNIPPFPMAYVPVCPISFYNP